MPRHLTLAEIGRGMSRHRAPRGRWLLVAGALAAVLVLVGGSVVVRLVADDSGSDAGSAGGPIAGPFGAGAADGPGAGASGLHGAACVELEVVSTAGFVPVLAAVQTRVASGAGCSTLRVTAADGAPAAAAAAAANVDAWVVDDAAWAGAAPKGLLAEGVAATPLATSPVYLVAGRSEAEAVQRAGGTWEALARLTATPAGVTLLVADPRSSAAGLTAVGGLGEAVWLASGMDASAAALARSFEHTRTVASVTELLPVRAGEVALVPEQVLLAQQAELRPDDVVLVPRDRTALLRYSLLQAAHAQTNPAKVEALRRVRAELDGADGGPLDPSVAAALDRAGLRRPGGPVPHPTPAAGGATGAPSAATNAAVGTLPEALPTPFDVLKPHHVDHVFAVWYPQSRRANALLVMDVSGSMGRRLPGGGTLIDAARQGSAHVAGVLPDDSVLSLWKFGTRLDGRRDYAPVVAPAPLAPAQRAAVAKALRGLRAQKTGTGLYDTILAAYRAVGRTARPGVPNHVLVFTDGRNESDQDSISAAELGAQLAAAARTAPQTSVVVLTYGVTGDAQALGKALEPVGGGVISVRTEEEVEAAFMHFAAGGLHSDG